VTSGEHPRARSAGLVGALIGAAMLLTLPTEPAIPSSNPPPPASSLWPRAARAEVAGTLPDGTAYTPLYFLDATSSIGSAPTPDGAAVRLLVHSGTAPTRELRRLPNRGRPQFEGFVGAGELVAWAESANVNGRRLTTMWSARPAGDEPARHLTSDTGGNVRLTGSQFDLTITGGRLSWASVGTGSATGTEIRSVPLDGGQVQSRTEPGIWSLAAPPWLISTPVLPRSGTTRLLNLETRRTVTVPFSSTEIPTCGAAWCRSTVLGDSGIVRIDLVRVDDSQRLRLTGANTGSPIPDVALLDRFEVFMSFEQTRGLPRGRPLLVYDIRSRSAVTIDNRAVTVMSRGSVLWWSTESSAGTTWHTLDLRSIP